MSKKISRSALGKKAGSTRNQRRKAEYKRKAEEQAQKSGRAGYVGKHAKNRLKRKCRLVGTAVHRVPCGNHACLSCRGA